MAVRGVNPYADEKTSSSGQTSSSSSEGRVVDGRWVYGDDNNYAGSKSTSKSSGGSSSAATGSYASVRGTEASPTIDDTNPYGGNITKGNGNIYTDNNANRYDYQALRDEALASGDRDLADFYNSRRNTKINDQDLEYALEYYNERTKKYEPRTAMPLTIESSSPGGYPEDAYDWLYNAAELSRDERTKTINDLSKNQEEQVRADYAYAIWKGQQELKNALENGKTRYNEAVAQNAINALQASDNLALRNAAAGDLGGIGGKLYSDQQASFDAQLGDIRNQEIQLYNDTEQQAALLEAQGNYELAQQVRQIGAEKLQSLLNLQDELWNAGREDYKWTLNYGMNYQQQALNNALTRVQMGLLTDADIEALGVSKEAAQGVADRYNQMAQLDLESAKLGLEQMAAQLAGTNLDNATKQAKLSGTYGGGSGGRGGGGGGGSSYYAQKIADAGGDAMALYGSLMAAGAVDKGSALSWLLAAGYKDTNADRLATAYAAWYDGQTNKKYDAWDYRNALYNNGYYDKAQQADAELYLKKALGFSDEDAELYAESYFTWLEGQMADLARQQRSANSPNSYALALTAGDAWMDNAGAGTDGLMSGQGALSFSSIPMTNDHTDTTLYIEGRPYTQSQFATLLQSGQIRDIGTSAMHHFINAASPEWAQSESWAERTPVDDTIPYNSVLELTDAYINGDITEGDYTYWLSRFNSPYGKQRETSGTLAKDIDMNAYTANNTALGSYQALLEKLNSGNPYTLPEDYWKTYDQER